MLKVQRFFEWMRHRWVQPGAVAARSQQPMYDSAATDAAILEQFERWKAGKQIDIVSITGPLASVIPAHGGASEGKGLELTVLYQEKV